MNAHSHFLLALPRQRVALIVRAVAHAFGVEAADMAGPGRVRRLVRPRQAAMGMVRHHPGLDLSFPRIGFYFSGRDHTTVLHATRLYEAWCDCLGLSHVHGAGDVALRAELMAELFGLTAPPSLLPLVPTPEEFAMSSPVPSGGPAALRLFGPCEIDPDTFRALPKAMRAEALRLAGESAKSDLLARKAGFKAGKALGLSRKEVEALLDGAADRHDLPSEREVEAQFAARGEVVRREDVVAHGAAHGAADGCAIEDPFARFAERHIRVDGRGELDVAAAFATYRKFCRRALFDAMPRSNFGAALLRLAKAEGGVRAGERMTALVLIEGAARPHVETVTFVAPPLPVASAERCRVLCRADVAKRPDAPAAVVVVRDPLAAFLEERLIERPGHVLSLERLREAIDGEGLSYHDVMARAEARGQSVRKNPWGPDFLTDAALVEMGT